MALELDIVIAQADDWEGLYSNGALLTEGHSLRLYDILEWLGEQGEVHITGLASKEVNFSWIEDQGNLPPLLTDVLWHNDPYVSPYGDDELDDMIPF